MYPLSKITLCPEIFSLDQIIATAGAPGPSASGRAPPGAWRIPTPPGSQAGTLAAEPRPRARASRVPGGTARGRATRWTRGLRGAGAAFPPACMRHSPRQNSVDFFFKIYRYPLTKYPLGHSLYTFYTTAHGTFRRYWHSCWGSRF